MAKKDLGGDDDAQAGRATPDQFMRDLGEFVTARTKRESATGIERMVKQRFEKMGIHKGGLALFLKLRDLEPEDAEVLLTTALRLCRWAKLPLGGQASMFNAASDDAGMPSEAAEEEVRDAAAYDRGFRAGKDGAHRRDNPYPVGQLVAARWDDGWLEAAELVDPDAAPKPAKKAGRKARSGNPEDRPAA